MTAYYNENDPKAAAWLRELIAHGHIAAGDVDERSIAEVRPDDLRSYRQCHFFAGIGGWSYALRLAGWDDTRPVWTGSCPCQPFSAAGKGLGEKDERHLWPEFRRLIAECAPPVVFGEQVASAAGRVWLAGVCADLEALGHRVVAADLCAAGVSAPHIRQRLFWLAVAEHARPHRAGEHPSVAISDGENRRLHHGSSAERLADSDGRRCEQCDAGERSFLLSATDGADGGMDDPANARRAGRRRRRSTGATRDEARLLESTGSSSPCGLDHTEHSRLEGQRGSENGIDESGRITPDAPRSSLSTGVFSPWSAFDLIPCRDGKARRVESGTFPLAHGVSSRVGLLRGYGNAIVPQVAAEFIQACEEALNG